MVVVEVHNTHGERHLYTLRHAERSRRAFVAAMDKEFFVSPFIDRHGRYSVPVRDEDARLRHRDRRCARRASPCCTSLVLRRRPLTDRTLLRMLVRHPLVPHKTIALIHWHALRLWLRGVPFHRHGHGRADDGVAAPLTESR